MYLRNKLKLFILNKARCKIVFEASAVNIM